MADLAGAVEEAGRTVKAATRSLEDAGEPVQDALAERDSFDDELDDAAQQARAQLAGRSASAAREKPYTLIFDRGIEYYLAAPLGEEKKRYEELSQRAQENLPADDPVRLAVVAAVGEGVSGFTAASDKLAKARTDESLAGTRLDAAEDAWATLIEKTYGALVERFGRRKADRFFPRLRRGGAGSGSEADGEAGGAPVAA